MEFRRFAASVILTIFSLGACTSQPQAGKPYTVQPNPSVLCALQNIMRPIWQRETNKAADLLGLSKAVLRFNLSVNGGHTENVKVVSNTGPETLAETAVVVVTEAVFPPMPRDVAAVLNDQPLHVEDSFTVRP